MNITVNHASQNSNMPQSPNPRLPKIAVLGAGHLGRIHMSCVQQSDALELLGYFDPNPEQCAKAQEKTGLRPFDSVEALLAACDIVDIVATTASHYELCKLAIEAGKPFFVEKPLCATVEQAREIQALAQAKGIPGAVGHVERFNPALVSLGDIQIQPMFVEAHRLATFNPRGNDVSVVLDLMIHDIDVLLSLVKSDIVSVQANGVAVVNPDADIANARIEFANGCVANLTASRISMKDMRKMRIFQPDAYISMDFMERKSEVVRLYDQPDASALNLMPLELPTGTRYISLDIPSPPVLNAIQTELEHFVANVYGAQKTSVSLWDGLQAMELAEKIQADIARRLIVGRL